MKATTAAVSGICTAVLTATLLAWIGTGMNPGIARCSLLAGAVIAIFVLAGPLLTGPATPRPGAWGWVAIALFALFTLRAFLWLIFADGDTIRILSPNNLGDMSLHLTFIRNFANGAPFWPENPIFAGQKLHYPIGMDIFNSLLLLCGVNVYRGLIWAGLAGSVLTGFALYRWGGAFTLAGFLCNGGFAGLLGFVQSIRDEGPGWSGFLAAHHFSDYQSDLAWKSLPLSMLVTQRGLLYAIPAGLALLCLWQERFFREPEKRVPATQVGIEILLYASMPLFHVHTFIFLSLLLGYWVLTGTRAVRVEAGKVIAGAVVPATLLVVVVTGTFQSASNLGWKPGWMMGEYVDKAMADAKEKMAAADESDVTQPAGGATEKAGQIMARLGYGAEFWMMNFGFLVPAVAGLVLILLRPNRRTSAEASLVFPAILAFVPACFVMFSKWDWDNTKLMIWSYIVILPFLYREIVARGPVLFSSFCAFALFGSGFICLVGGLDGTHTGYELAKRSELDGVEKAVRRLPSGAIFACYPTYNHPLLLNGRNVVMGYTGHLFSYGIDFTAQQANLTAVMNGSDGWLAQAKAMGVHYLFWGAQEEAASEYKGSKKPWETECEMISNGPSGKLFDLLKPAEGRPDF